MNLPNKLTMSRIVLAAFVLVLLILPFYHIGFIWPKYSIAGEVTVDLKYIICGVLFVVASLTDWFDGKIARKRGLVTQFGKVMDTIADKVLVNGVLIVLAYDGFIPIVVPVIIIIRDIFVDSIKMISWSKGSTEGASRAGKIKAAIMMFGIVLVFFYNLPTSLFNIALGNYLILIATILSIYSGIQYYYANQKYFSDK